MTKCRFCNKNKKLIRAHIIPKNFYNKLRTSTDASIIVEFKQKSRGNFERKLNTQKSQMGIYDKYLLCKECDSRLGIYDKYSYEIFLNPKHFKKKLTYIDKSDAYGIYKIDEFDFSKLQLFFISILWRASISTHKFYENINLGLLETKAKECLVKDSADKDYFSVVAFKLSTKMDVENICYSVLTPLNLKDNGVNIYKFYFGGFQFIIKADSRKFNSEYKKVEISPGKPIIIPEVFIEEDQYIKKMLFSKVKK